MRAISAPSPAPAPTPLPAPSAPGSVPSVLGIGDQFFAALPAGRWASMAASSTIRKTVAQYAPNYREYGSTGLSAITRAWAGGAFDQATGWYYMTGGGHYDSNFNGIVSANVETGLFGMAIQPTVLTPQDVADIQGSWGTAWLGWGQTKNGGNGLYANGLPGGTHTYGSTWFDNGRVILSNRVYTLSTKTLYSIPNSVMNNPSNIGVRTTKKLVSMNNISDDYWDIIQIDPVTLTEKVSHFRIVPVVDGHGEAYSFNGECHACAIGDVVYIINTNPRNTLFGNVIAWSIDLTEDKAGYDAKALTIVKPWTPEELVGIQGITAAFDGTLMYIPSKDCKRLLTWNPRTGACGRISIPGPAPEPQDNPAYGRFQWYAKRNCFTLVNSIDEPIYYLRLSVG